MFFEDLCLYLDNNRIEYIKEAKIASYVSIRVGGIASLIAYPDTVDKFCGLINFVKGKIKYFVLGNGTNCYFSDYYDGIIILTNKLNGIMTTDCEIIAECGASLTRCAVYAYENSFTGIEFLYGIPGSVGGGVYMNASAYGSMISEYIKECTVYDASQNTIKRLNRDDLKFEAKHSVFMEKEYFALSVTFDLAIGDKDVIKSTMETYLGKRIASQPLDLPNAGSAFKRPKNDYASKLIDRAGLKGYRIGDAEISTKHAGFIVNMGNATANDINLLLLEIKAIIKRKFDIELEEEIIFVE